MNWRRRLRRILLNASLPAIVYHTLGFVVDLAQLRYVTRAPFGQDLKIP